MSIQSSGAIVTAPTHETDQPNCVTLQIQVQIGDHTDVIGRETTP